MRTRWAGALVVVALATGSVSPVARAVGPPLLTITGPGARSATLTVLEPTEWNWLRAVAKGEGTYVGVVLTGRTRHEEYGGFIDVPRRLNDPRTTSARTLLHRDTVSLAPGTYRVHLLADGPAQVYVPLQRGTALTVDARAPSRQWVGLAETSTAAGDRVVAALRRPLNPTSTRIYAFGEYAGATGPQYLELRVCLARRGRRCGRDDFTTVATGDTMGLGGAALVGMGIRDALRDKDVRVELSTSALIPAVLWLTAVQVVA